GWHRRRRAPGLADRQCHRPRKRSPRLSSARRCALSRKCVRLGVPLPWFLGVSSPRSCAGGVAWTEDHRRLALLHPRLVAGDRRRVRARSDAEDRGAARRGRDVRAPLTKTRTMTQPTIRTVLGDVAPAELGATNYHEHLFQISPLLPGDELDDEDAS